jgi:hypothetical protein
MWQVASIRRVDEVLIPRHYHSIMRRLWFTILTIIALAVSGFTSAVAAQSCPVLTGDKSMQDCGSTDGMQMSGMKSAPQKQMPASNSDKMAGCYLGQACRSVPVVTPTLEPLRISLGVVMQPQLLINTPAPATGSVRDFWRPPRSI